MKLIIDAPYETVEISEANWAMGILVTKGSQRGIVKQSYGAFHVIWLVGGVSINYESFRSLHQDLTTNGFKLYQL